MFLLSRDEGSSLVSVLIGLALIVSAALFFARSTQDFEFAKQKFETKSSNHQLIIEKALVLQNLSFDELLSATKSAKLGKLEDCATSAEASNIATNPSLNLLGRWIPIDEAKEYCLLINRWELIKRGRILDIEVKLYIKLQSSATPSSESLAQFRKAR